MKRKQFLALALAGMLALSLAGCGGASSAPAADKDYAQIIHNARPDDINEAYLILSPDKTGKNTYTAIDGFSKDIAADELSMQADMLLQMLNLNTADMEDYAISISLMNVKSYAVAIIRPADGKADTIQQALQTYVDTQKSNMQTYLPDQYEIANAAQIVTADSGEVILVCCEDSDTVLSSIQSALKG